MDLRPQWISLWLAAFFGAILLFVFVGWVILTAVAWITRTTIIHHFGFDPFPFVK